MNRKKAYLGLILTLPGIAGILSVLTMDIPVASEIRQILEPNFSPVQTRLLLLANPAVLLTIAVVTGFLPYQKGNPKFPSLEELLEIDGRIGFRVVVPEIGTGKCIYCGHLCSSRHCRVRTTLIVFLLPVIKDR